MNWIKYRPLYFLISAIVLTAGIWSLLTSGLKPALDFTGGSKLTLEAAISDDLNSAVAELLPDAQIDTAENSLEVQTHPLSQAEADKFLLDLVSKGYEVKLLAFATVGPSAGALLLKQTLIAAALATVGILLYISSAFKSFRYGVSAIGAMFHDTLVLLGTFSLLGRFLEVRVDLLFVTALLTTLSFSVHDTIVLFDRTRELKRHHSGWSFEQMANRAITDTLIRSLNNSMTIIFMLLALVLLGGETIRWFAIALLVGAVTGTYSSPFVAIPLLSLWQDRKY